jgi:hypothetical protein
LQKQIGEYNNFYILFKEKQILNCDVHSREEFKVKYPDARSREIVSLLGKAWKELNDEEKKVTTV